MASAWNDRPIKATHPKEEQALFRRMMAAKSAPLVVLWFWCFLVFALVAFLSGTPWAHLLYAAFLSFIGVLFFVFRMLHAEKQKKALLERVSAEDVQVLKKWPGEGEGLLIKKLQEMERQHRAYKNEVQIQSQETKDYFTLWVHQIKTPISAMTLILEKQGALPQAVELSHELLRIEDYTSLALSYVKLDERSTDLDFSTICVDEVLRRVIKRYKTLFIHGQIRLEFEPTPVQVVTDGWWLGILFEQLLGNALKYTPPGGTISITPGPKDGTLFIKDTGIGIPSEDLPRIFEGGFSGLNGRLSEKSTGLGLFLVRQILRRLGHEIRITSPKEGGTTVFLDLSRSAEQGEETNVFRGSKS
ncbi:Histidine kinase [Clostridiaceae bacterium JG1575]|nr:Histidine kinase [Clostridiaceae bacterium JG1575]